MDLTLLLMYYRCFLCVSRAVPAVLTYVNTHPKIIFWLLSLFSKGFYNIRVYRSEGPTLNEEQAGDGDERKTGGGSTR